MCVREMKERNLGKRDKMERKLAGGECLVIVRAVLFLRERKRAVAGSAVVMVVGVGGLFVF